MGTPDENMRSNPRARRDFALLWLIVTAIKLLVAARLPLFVDEAFYWQESRHPAWAYSDLPGMTAWLVRMGVAIGGNHVLAVRAPFLLIGALLPWLLARVGARWFGEENGWRTGCLALLMPLPATLGIMALPDVPLALATVLCVDAVARLLREVEAIALFELAAGLALGALSHYRFAGVVAVGCIALAMLPQGRKLARDWRAWLAAGIGTMAWLPLLLWNLRNADAGLRFQLIDRHPWALQWTGAEFVLFQVCMATPLLLLAMAQVAWRARKPDANAQWRFFALFGGGSTLAYFLLGFFADSERVSFHWTLPGYLALLVVVPGILAVWPRGLQRTTWALASLSMLAMLGYYAAMNGSAFRENLADGKFYPTNFSGWDTLADAVAERLAAMPPGSRVVADNFKLGAELGFVRGDADIGVLPHSLNDKHGRTPQLREWGLLRDGRLGDGTLLVLSLDDVKFRELLARYQFVCAHSGALLRQQVVATDMGAKRFLLAEVAGGECMPPAIAYISVPESVRVKAGPLAMRGWAIKDGVGIATVNVTVDGKAVAPMRYHERDDFPGQFYAGQSRDPNLPNIAFVGNADFSRIGKGWHVLGVELTDGDGRREHVVIRPIHTE